MKMKESQRLPRLDSFRADMYYKGAKPYKNRPRRCHVLLLVILFVVAR